MSIGMSLWQLQYGEGQPSLWHDMWLHFEKFDEFITPLGKGRWVEKDNQLYLKFPWDDAFHQVQLAPGLNMMMTTFNPEKDFLSYLIKREQNTPYYGFIFLWQELKRYPFPFDISSIEDLSDNEKKSLSSQLGKLEWKFNLVMSSLQTVSSSILAKDQKWFIQKHSFSNQEILKQLVELQVKLPDTLIKLVDELSTLVIHYPTLFSEILNRLEVTYTYYIVQIKRAAYMRDPILGDQIAGMANKESNNVMFLFKDSIINNDGVMNFGEINGNVSSQ